MSKQSDDALVKVVRLLGRAAHAAYDLSFSRQAEWAKFKNPKVGDLILETSTYFMLFADVPTARHAPASPLDGIGILEEDVVEPMDVPEWDEKRDGPVPTERAFYIRTFDGRRFRWVNASMIKVPTDLNFMRT